MFSSHSHSHSHSHNNGSRAVMSNNVIPFSNNYSLLAPNEEANASASSSATTNISITTTPSSTTTTPTLLALQHQQTNNTSNNNIFTPASSSIITSSSSCVQPYNYPSPLDHQQQHQSAQLPSKKPRKRRSLPGHPDPDAEILALSPRTLLATNRFICDVCGKGFQRDQNLQLHRRGHNLPWKLKQRSTAAGEEAARKKAYVCPEPSCVHHHPSRALGDLTGIKKHFCRKHGEKKFRCDKCEKSYAVYSDWKAHTKTCGTKEYRCNCGTLFSRKDSFITHRAFCDALAEESARVLLIPTPPLPHPHHPLPLRPPPSNYSNPQPPPPPPPIQSHGHGHDPNSTHHNYDSIGHLLPVPPPSCFSLQINNDQMISISRPPLLPPLFTNNDDDHDLHHKWVDLRNIPYHYHHQYNQNPNDNNRHLMTSSSSGLFQPPPPVLSATALLQKACTMGVGQQLTLNSRPAPTSTSSLSSSKSGTNNNIIGPILAGTTTTTTSIGGGQVVPFPSPPPPPSKHHQFVGMMKFITPEDLSTSSWRESDHLTRDFLGLTAGDHRQGKGKGGGGGCVNDDVVRVNGHLLKYAGDLGLVDGDDQQQLQYTALAQTGNDTTPLMMLHHSHDDFDRRYHHQVFGSNHAYMP